MGKFSYIAEKYTQTPNGTGLISFTASAEEIKEWGGVPAKNEQFHGGFQRALSPRYKKIISYFNRSQLSPGAIVVAFRPGALQMTDIGYPSSWPQMPDKARSPNYVHIEFSSDSFEEDPLDVLISKVRKMLEHRPGFSQATVAQEESPTPEDEELVDVDAEGSVSDEEGELDVGQSKLLAFYNFIGDKARVDKWISVEKQKIDNIKKKRNLSKVEKEYVLDAPEFKLRSTLVSLLRPAMIVDGQHRINGAVESDHEGIRFTVCALSSADWVEQVFQFVILNRMAKPISKDFLTELLNTSLTNAEVKEIDKRLEAVGITNSDRTIHKYINHDSDSPFFGMIAEAGEVTGISKDGKLSQPGMLALAKRWRLISGSKNTAEISCFLKYLNVGGLMDARKAWTEKVWIEIFFRFWKEVRALYEPHQVWVKEKNFNLLYIVTLQAMQDHFIETKANAKVKFLSIDDFGSQVREFFEEVPPTFFTHWSETGLQSGKGWEYIKKAIGMFQQGKQLSTVRASSELFS